MNAAIDGAIGGNAATIAMSAAMEAAQRAGLLGEMPPKKITDAALDAAGLDPPEDVRDGLAVVHHFGFGMAMGALYGMLARRTPRAIPAPIKGAFFGALVWTGSYAGWVPALKIMPPPERDRPGRPISMFVAHLIYGAVLGALVGR